MKTEVQGKKIRMTIEVDFYPENGQLYVNGEPMNQQVNGKKVGAWLGANRFIGQMVERFYQTTHR
jgi:hypothetical protein